MAIAGVLAGCGDPAARFEPDRLLQASVGLSADQSAAVDSLLDAWFGDPDEPRLPFDLAPQLAALVDLAALEQCAGPVESHTPGVTHGLYRRHCARCHGVTGNGRGPTARYQAPYPRDFRRGVFKWKRTERGAAPTDDDLRRVLEHGVAGTAMPSFGLLVAEEREQLLDYVKYLAIRGETERALTRYVAEVLPAEATIDRDDLTLVEELADESLRLVVARWVAAEQAIVESSESIKHGAPDAELLARGEALFHGERAGCAKCHGQQGRGVPPAELVADAVGWDDWSIDRTDDVLARLPASVRAIAAADLPTRLATPRGLIGRRGAVGAEPADLFARVHQGVAGTPMPAAGGPGGLTDDEVAAVAAYTATLLFPDESGGELAGESAEPERYAATNAKPREALR